MIGIPGLSNLGLLSQLGAGAAKIGTGAADALGALGGGAAALAPPAPDINATTSGLIPRGAQAQMAQVAPMPGGPGNALAGLGGGPLPDPTAQSGIAMQLGNRGLNQNVAMNASPDLNSAALPNMRGLDNTQAMPNANLNSGPGMMQQWLAQQRQRQQQPSLTPMQFPTLQTPQSQAVRGSMSPDWQNLMSRIRQQQR